MKFYRLNTYKDGGNSNGYRWFTVREEAQRAQASDHADDPTEKKGTIEEIHITPTRTGILTALRFYAGHPDNG